MHLHEGGIEGADMVARGSGGHAAHEDLPRIPGLRDDEEGGLTEGTGGNFRDAECRGVWRLAEARESPVRRHGPSDGTMVRMRFQDSPIPGRGTRGTAHAA